MVTISISDALYRQALHIAQRTDRPVEEVIGSVLEHGFNPTTAELPEDDREELTAMRYLSDDTLWTIAREQMPKSDQERISILMTRNSDGIITADEHAELSGYVERAQRLMLRKSKAMAYLTERGFSITLDDLSPVDE